MIFSPCPDGRQKDDPATRDILFLFMDLRDVVDKLYKLLKKQVVRLKFKDRGLSKKQN